MADWIDTNDMMPEKGVYVFVLTTFQELPLVLRRDEVAIWWTYDKKKGEAVNHAVDGWWTEKNASYSDFGVTHWMPIPDSPFEE